MTATVITTTTVKTPWETVTAGSTDFVLTACTETDGDEWTCNGRDVVLFQNTNVGAQTVTFTAYDDNQNRIEDLTYSIGASEYFAWCGGLTNAKGWQSSSRVIKFTASSADVKACVLRLPAGFPGG